MANTTGTFQYLGANGLPIGVLDSDVDTGTFAYLGVTGLPLAYLWDFGAAPPEPPVEYTHALADVLTVEDFLDATQPGMPIADALSLGDTLGMVGPSGMVLGDPLNLGDTLEMIGPSGMALGDTLSLGDTLDLGGLIGESVMFSDTLPLVDSIAMLRRMGAGSVGNWFNPPRLAETLWTSTTGTCACGLGHVGPQGCNAETAALGAEPLLLTDALSWTYTSEPPEPLPALATGFEGGEGESTTIAPGSVYRSLTWSGFSPYLDAPPPLKTDVVHSGMYSLQLGGLSPGGSASGMTKILYPTIPPPWTFSQKMYLYLVAKGTQSFIGVGGFGDYDGGHSPYLNAIIGTGTVFGGGSGLARIGLEGHNFSGASIATYGTVDLQTGRWYRMYTWMTVAANGLDWTWGFTLYDGDTMTIVDQIVQSGSNFVTGPGTRGSLMISGLGDIWDLDRSLELRVDDCVFSTSGLLSRNPFGMALINPATDVSTQWTRVGSAPAASNALNVAHLPGPLSAGLTQANRSNTAGLVDRFGVDISRVPDRPLHRGYFFARGNNGGATNGVSARVWDAAGNSVTGPEMTELDGASVRTDDLLTVPLGGVSHADLANYSLGYISSGIGSADRTVIDAWGLVEYPL